MLHCLHNTLLSISREQATGDLICSSVQPKAALLVFPAFPFTYSTRWHLRPRSAHVGHGWAGCAAPAAPLTQYTLSTDKGKGSSTWLRRQAKLRYGLRVKDQGQAAGSMPSIEGFLWNWIYLSWFCQGWQQEHLLQECVATALSILCTTASTHMYYITIVAKAKDNLGIGGLLKGLVKKSHTVHSWGRFLGKA